jgi:hypothetical protein
MRDDPILLTDPSYTPQRLLDEVMWIVRAANRNQMAQLLELDKGLVSRIWHRQAPLTAGILLRIMDCTGWGAQYVRQLAGMPYEGPVFAPRPRVIKLRSKHKTSAATREAVLMSLPGTVAELAKKSGYSKQTVKEWIRALRAGDPLNRASHIVGWVPPKTRGPHHPIHAAGPGEDAVCVIQPRSKERHYIARGTL